VESFISRAADSLKSIWGLFNGVL